MMADVVSDPPRLLDSTQGLDSVQSMQRLMPFGMLVML